MSREYSDVKNEKEMNPAGNDEGLLNITMMVDDAFKGIQRYWVFLLAVLSICSSLFYFRAKSTYTPQYRASVTFIVNTNTALNYSSEYYNKATASQIAKTFPYIISNAALQRIIEEDLGVKTIPGKIEAAAMEDTNLITISATSDDPGQAYDILQSVIKNYPRIARSVIGDTELNVMDETGMPMVPTNFFNGRSAGKRGFLAGLVICAGFLGLYVMTKRTIRREEDFKRLLNVKCLGSVPRVKFKKRSSLDKNRVMIDNRNVSYGFIEANRTIRTRIERDSADEGAKIYMVSSAIAGEGKSTVAANLALSLANKGRRTLLIDMDLRNPSIKEVLGIQNVSKGMSDFLMGRTYLMDVMIDYGDTGLKVVPGGEPVRSTAKILNDTRIKMLFTAARKMADIIIVDTPPSGVLTDAAQIAKWVDAGIFVVRQDYASVDRVLDGIEMLVDTGLRLTGCALNYAEVGITGYGYGYGYGYGRYGSYGKYGKYGKSKYTVKPEDEKEDNE